MSYVLPATVPECWKGFRKAGLVGAEIKASRVGSNGSSLPPVTLAHCSTQFSGVQWPCTYHRMINVDGKSRVFVATLQIFWAFQLRIACSLQSKHLDTKFNSTSLGIELAASQHPQWLFLHVFEAIFVLEQRCNHHVSAEAQLWSQAQRAVILLCDDVPKITGRDRERTLTETAYLKRTLR